MAAIKNKIKDLMHKDDTTTGTGTGTTSGTTSTGAQHKGGVGQAVKGAMSGYDATTSTGRGGPMNTGNEQDVRTGMADLDITTGTNTADRSTGTTTGLSDRGTTGAGITSDRSYETGTTTGTGMGSGTGMGTSRTDNTGGISQGVTRSYDTATNEVIDSERFTKTEDHEVVIEKKAYELEHRPVQKQYVVETRFEGERAVPGKATELLSTEAREVEERVVQMPQGDREIIVENVDLPVGSEVVESHRVNLPHTHTQSTGTGGSTIDRLRNTVGGTGTGTTGTGSYSSGTTGTGAGTTGTDTYGSSTTGTGAGGYGSGTGTGTGTTY